MSFDTLQKAKNGAGGDLSDFPWAARERLRFIEGRLFWSGKLRRADIIDRFGVHPSVASTDLASYQKLAPGNAEYDRYAKTYKAGRSFIPRITAPAMDHLFGHALLGDDQAAPEGVFAWVAAPRLYADPSVVRGVIEAALHPSGLSVFYRSMTNPQGGWRWIEPHSIVFDGQRWHTRAWCSRRHEFRDFALGRIERTGATRPSKNNSDDKDWLTILTLRITPHSALSAEQAEIVMRDYQMTDGRLDIECRRALIGYLLINLGLDRDLAPPRQTIELANPSILNEVPWIRR